MRQGKNKCAWVKVHTREPCGKSCMGSIVECICNKSGVARRCRSHVGVVVSARRQRRNDAKIVASKPEKLAFVEEGRMIGYIN